MRIKERIKHIPLLRKALSVVRRSSLSRKAFVGRIALAISPRLHNAIYHSLFKGEKMNLRDPRLFNEKVAWLMYYVYNKSKLVALCSDKLAVRDYVKDAGLAHILVPLLGCWSRIEDINWSINENCVYKATNNSGGNVYHFVGNDFDAAEAVKRLKLTDYQRKRFWISGEKFACVRKDQYICEKYISQSTSEYPIDYKFYCFHGVPTYVLCCMNRIEKTKVAFLDMDWKIRSDLRQDSINTPPKRPDNFETMIECAKRLSRSFPFVRVDLYSEAGKIYFGELTFTPSTPYNLARNHGKQGMEELGRLIDLSRAEIKHTAHTEGA